MLHRLFFALMLFVFTSAFAANRPAFEAKSDDLTVVDKCETYKPSFFIAEPINYFTVGIEGTKRVGVTEEVPVTRGEAKILWAALYPKSSAADINRALDKINQSEDLKDFYSLLEEGKIERGATYNSEGEILEVLAYTYLLESESFLQMVSQHFEGKPFSQKDFFVTGGVTYHDTKNGRTIGELDVIVGDSKTCTVFGIGEAKLGGKLNKARQQLARIRSYIQKL